jgi:hypothetical protein
MSTLLAELQRRKVFKVGAAYLVVAWLVVQGASIGFPAFEAPPWALRVFILVLMLGFPIALVMAWVFEATPDGFVRETKPVGSAWMQKRGQSQFPRKGVRVNFRPGDLAADGTFQAGI